MNALRRQRWFDRLVGVGFLTACEVEVIVRQVGGHTRSYLLPVGVLAAAVTTVPLWWRRRAPLATTCAEMAGLVLLFLVVDQDAAILNTAQLILFFSPYSVAAHSSRRRAFTGLAVCLGAVGTCNLIAGGDATSWLFSMGACAASWGLGRFIHTQRALAVELKRTSDQITVETESRERLAVAEQRTQIARELQTLVADNVSAMIVQAQAAQRLLETDSGVADKAMASIEETGRAALSEMRLILGVLRRSDQPVELAPQPGIGQIPALVDRARTKQRQVALRVEGEPGPLPASVDLGVYRILEDAIAIEERAALEITLQFGDERVSVLVTSAGCALGWPTVGMRERVALCEGELEVVTKAAGETLIVQLPRVLRGVLA